MPWSSCKCSVQLLLCPPSHSQLCDLPLHLSPRPQPQRHARANEPGSSSSSSSSREAAAKSHLPTPSSPTQKRERKRTTSQSIILLVSNPSGLLHSSPTLSHLLLPPLQPLSFARARACLSPQDVQRLRAPQSGACGAGGETLRVTGKGASPVPV